MDSKVAALTGGTAASSAVTAQSTTVNYENSLAAWRNTSGSSGPLW